MSSMQSNNTTPKNGWKRAVYNIAEGTLKVAISLWTTAILTFLVGFAVNLATANDLDNNFNKHVLPLFFTLANNHVTALGVVALFVIGIVIVATSVSALITQFMKPPAILEWQELVKRINEDILATKDREKDQKKTDEEGFKHYLRFMKEMNRCISPRGLFQQSRALILADAPLDKIFVHLSVVPCRPLYDAPYEQQRQFARVEKRTDMSIKKHDTMLQRLCFTWYSPSTQKIEKAPQAITTETLLPQLTSEHPVAIILGTPGSGKTTFLRWLAFSKTQAALDVLDNIQAELDALSKPKITPNALSKFLNILGTLSKSKTTVNPPPTAQALQQKPEQILIFIQTHDYAERLEKDSITIKQFFIAQANRIHPNAAPKVLEALEQGRCLIVFDGLDEGFSTSVRRRVREAIATFITEYSVSNAETNGFNRFIIASRIADYDPTAFTDYPCYTLLALDDSQINSVMAKWCHAIERQRIASIRGIQPITEQELIVAGRKLQQQVESALKANLSLRRLASNPLTLMMMAFLQANGKDLLLSRFDLYQMITRTLLDTWNRESGRKMFSEEEMLLVETLLCHLADRLQNSNELLTRYDIEITTRKTMSMFYAKQEQVFKENEITYVIETMRRSSGLFVEVGDNLFCFANQTFQEYFSTLSLLNQTPEIRKHLVERYANLEQWREPLLLMQMHEQQVSR
ncbi:MAG: hypothetical protein NVS4B11_37610 [Ktedonobacteraceae bacterium]